MKVRVESEGKVWSLSGHDRETWSKTESTGPPATALWEKKWGYKDKVSKGPLNIK